MLRDLPRAIRGMGFVPFCKKVWFEVGDDNLWTWASALAYSWLFAIFPFFLVLLSLIPTLKYEWRIEAKNQINNAVNASSTASGGSRRGTMRARRPRSRRRS